MVGVTRLELATSCTPSKHSSHLSYTPILCGEPRLGSRGPHLAGETGFEPATHGFGDRCSTVEPLPCLGGVTTPPDGVHHSKEMKAVSIEVP